jgi:hypothetical protein
MTLCIITLSSYGQVKIYRLADKTNHADIDHNKLLDLNRCSPGYSLFNKLFRPVTGKYTVYRFLATYKGMSHRTEKNESFHDVVILKTDISNHIIDAYQYTLEWSEMPLTYDLYKLTVNGLKLDNQLKIAAFKFKRMELDSVDPKSNQYLNDAGYLLPTNSKQ